MTTREAKRSQINMGEQLDVIEETDEHMEELAENNKPRTGYNQNSNNVGKSQHTVHSSIQGGIDPDQFEIDE